LFWASGGSILPLMPRAREVAILSLNLVFSVSPE
jgi:hypothetical protein